MTRHQLTSATGPSRLVKIRGNVIDQRGFSIPPGLLRETRIALRAHGRPIGNSVTPEYDGSFVLEEHTNEPRLTLHVSTRIKVSLVQGTLDYLAASESAVPSDKHEGDVLLPRSRELGSIEFSVVDFKGQVLKPEYLSIEAVEGTSTPKLLIERLDELDLVANAPTEYRKGGHGVIRSIPPGEYWLRPTVLNRWMPAARVSVSSGPTVVTLAEQPSSRRVRGVVREAAAGRPLENVRITVASSLHLGTAHQDPSLIVGITSDDGSYDLPLPDSLPQGGLRLSFARPGYGRSDLQLDQERFRGGHALTLNLDLGRD